MSNVKMTDILSVTNVKKKDDIYIESCGEFDNQLNGYFIVLRDDKVNDLIDYVVMTFGDSYSQMLKDILSSNDEEDIASSIKTFSPDVDKTYTELFLDDFGTPSRLKSFVEQENLMRGDAEPSEEPENVVEESTPKGTDELSEEDMLLAQDNIKPEEPDSVNPDLEKEVRDLESKLADETAVNLLLTKSNDELNSKVLRLTDKISDIELKYEKVKVPDFAVDSLIKIINDVSSASTKDSLVMLVQSLASLEDNYVLDKLIEGLVENYITLGAISIDQFEQEK